MPIVDSSINRIDTEEDIMIELYQLRQLLAFAKYGTLSEAAEKLYLSQPALSRNMRKLEEEIGVPLFERRRNKLELNENGKLTAELAEKVISDFDVITIRVQDFDRNNRTIYAGFCAPAMIWQLSPLLAQFYPNMSIQTELTADEQHLLNGLLSGQFQLAVTHTVPDDDRFYCKPCGTESLMFSLPPDHRYADRKSLTFAEMDGENMLQLSDLGIWADVHDKYMPHSRFLTQSDRYTFEELLNASILPSFNTDLAQKYMGIKTDRISVPIEDEGATVQFYLVCLSKNRKQYALPFQHL